MSKFRLDATLVYLFIEFAASASFSMMFVVTSLYEVTVAGLSPLQLVLVGTAVEASAFLFEVPTGIVADAYSRRLSLIIGYLLMGIGFMVEALFPAFLPILLAQVIWGLGYTFTSGATQAWITDEIGEEPANRLFLRAAQVGLFAAFLGMGAAGLVGANNVVLPLRVGALAVMLIGVALIFIMPETGFKPLPRENRNTWQHMTFTFRQGVQAVRSRPRLTSLVWVGLFYGLYSEGFDRLWVKHLLDNFHLPVLVREQPGSIPGRAAHGRDAVDHAYPALCGKAGGHQQPACHRAFHVMGDRLHLGGHCGLCPLTYPGAQSWPLSRCLYPAQYRQPPADCLDQPEIGPTGARHCALHVRAGGCHRAGRRRARRCPDRALLPGRRGHIRLRPAADTRLVLHPARQRPAG